MLNKIIELTRSFLVIFCFAFFGIGALVISYIIFPLQKLLLKNGDNLKIKYNEILQKSWQFFVWMLKSFRIIKIKSDDIEIMKRIKNSIIVSTHPSYIDILLLMSIIPHSTCFVADRLIHNPFFREIVKQLFISEGQPVNQWISEANEMLEDGFNIIIFPMGTRHRKNEYPKIRRGTALLAQKSGRNIVMLNMETSFDFLQINQPVYEAGNKAVEYQISYFGEINTAEYLNKYTDDVTFKTEVTKLIGQKLYHGKN